jgi:hypothetical protein
MGDWPESRRYVMWSSANWIAFLAIVAFLSWGRDKGSGRLPDAAVWALVLFLTATVAAQFVAAYRLVAAQDEFIRALTAKRGIAAAGLTIAAAVLCGLGQQFLSFPPAPMWVVYPFFWGAFGMVTPLIRDSHA